MKSLNINSGEVRLAINGDENNLLVFNPSDILFTEKFYALAKDFDEQEKQFLERVDAIEKESGVDEHGMPANAPAVFALVKELCEYIWERFDDVFGEGVSQRLFAGVYSVDMLNQFLEGITPYIESERKSKIGRYTQQPTKTNVIK